MKVTVHHLPTGCIFERELEGGVKEFADTVFKAGEGFVIGDDKGCIFFPADIIKESVIKVVE